MQVAGKVCVITGAGRGIGAAMARRFAQEGAAGIVVADLDAGNTQAVAREIADLGVAALGLRTDVAVEAEVQALVSAAMERFGRIDLFCSNAGIFVLGDERVPDDDWQRCWQVNVMAHVYASRAVVPLMLAQGSGYLLNTCSSAGVLTGPGTAPYTAAKHAAVGFAEWLSIKHGDQGIKVSALCPAGVRTEMLAQAVKETGAPRITTSGEIMEPEAVAQAVIDGLAAERFLILPHAAVGEEMKLKGADREAWLARQRAGRR